VAYDVLNNVVVPKTEVVDLLVSYPVSYAVTNAVDVLKTDTVLLLVSVSLLVPKNVSNAVL
jgi:hypothetical protein